MRISKIFKSIQSFAKKVSENEKLYNRINNTILPVSESVIATSMYAVFIQNNKNIEQERKPALHYQNIICGLSGMLLANKINKSIQKHQDNIIKIIKNKNIIDNPESFINGLKIAMPLIVFSSIIRFLLPIISTPISSKINEKVKQGKLNMIA